MIYTFVPYSTEKNFGKAINDCCQIVPNQEDWICIRDGDAMNLTPDWGMIIQEAIDNHGNEFDLFGCWTNRLNLDNGRHQITTTSTYHEKDVLAHHYFAKSINKLGIGITQVPSIAGFFMLFKKKTWIQAGGFIENSVQFDTDFCRRVKFNGGKIGLINRLYMFHLYRIWAKGDAGSETDHLI
jgi:GT2 family glycosyltransferase